MKTVKYRSVLWSIAYKIGIQPDFNRGGQGLLESEADEITSSVNAYMRRLFPIQDEPEWTRVLELRPNSSHIVPYTVQLGAIIGTETIGRVFKVYLLDPTTTVPPVEIGFKLTDSGVFVGLNHGPTVWVKYIADTPQFTAKEWDATFRYGKGELTYSPISGECYKSRVANNLGHNPIFIFSPQPNGGDGGGGGGGVPVPVTTDQEADVPSVGAPAQHQIMSVSLKSAGQTDIADPAPVGSYYSIIVLDASNSVLATATHTVVGIPESLDSIATNLIATLTGALPGSFVVTEDVTTKRIIFDNASNFKLTNPDPETTDFCYYTLAGSGPLRLLDTFLVQAYIPTTSSGTFTQQVASTIIGSTQLLPGSEYNVRFIDGDGTEHIATYASDKSDGREDIMTGVLNSLSQAAVSDDYFSGVKSTVDLTQGKIVFTTDRPASIDLTIIPPGSAWWELVQMPFNIQDQIIRGVVADLRGTEGQQDKQDDEEGKVQTETSVATQRFTTPVWLPLTDQQKPRTRFKVQ